MAHPMASQSARSTASRLKRIAGKGSSAGKAWGSTAMSSKTGASYPSKNAGSQVPYFADGGSVGMRPDRLARGGFGKPKGKSKGKKGGGHTNVVVQVPPPAPAAGAGAGAVPVPVPKPVPVPVPAGGPPPRPVLPPGAPAGGPPLPPPGLGAGPMGPPPGLPGMPPPGLRPPGMKRGGSLGFKKGGSVKGYEQGGRVEDEDDDFVPPKEVDDYKSGGSVKHAQLGGIGARPVIGAAARTAGLAKRGAMANRAAVNRQAIRDAGAAANPRAAAAAAGGRPPRPFKDGGKVHDDEAQDKKLISKMIKKEDKDEKYARGGGIKQGGDGSEQATEPGGYPVMKNAAGGGLGRLEKRSKGER